MDETEGVRKGKQWCRNHSGGSNPDLTTFWSEQQVRVVINACIIATTVFTRLQAPSELTPTSSRGLDMKEKSAIKRLSRIEAWSTKTSKIEAWLTKFKVHTCTM